MSITGEKYRTYWISKGQFVRETSETATVNFKLLDLFSSVKSYCKFNDKRLSTYEEAHSVLCHLYHTKAVDFSTSVHIMLIKIDFISSQFQQLISQVEKQMEKPAKDFLRLSIF